MANGYSSYTPTGSNELTTYVTRTNLYTEGGEYALPNGKEYIGFYHIHPEKGAMVGANHSDEFHEILLPIANQSIPKISSVELVNNFSYDEYSEKDLKLISPARNSVSEFKPSTDRIEFSIYTEQGLLDVINYNYTDYSILSGLNPATGVVASIDIDPGSDLIREGYTQGFYQIIYNFLRDKVNSTPEDQYYISQISADRTELRLASNILSNEQIAESANAFIEELNASPFFEDFYLNFGNNSLITGLKIALDDEDNPDQFSIIIKLYEALPPQFELKDSLWVSLQTAEAVSFDVEFAPKISQLAPPKFIKGPNFNVTDQDLVNNSTVFQTAKELTTTVLTSSLNELKNVLNQKGVKVSIDYEDYNNFVYFSSAQSRLENFYYKVKEIEDFQSEIDTVKGLSNSSTSGSQALLENKITNIIANFDEYENFLYYNSGSAKTWPKLNTIPPYTLYSTSSIEVSNWYGTSNELDPLGQLGTASLYDINNTDRLVNSLPEYVKGNPINQSFFTFMDMVGQHFDVLWTYTKAVGDRYDADNRLNSGISKDIVADAIRSMGISLYQNNFSSNDLASSFLGINASGSLLPPTGSEVINTYVTASNDLFKLDNVNKETYKRIFHNLPFILKRKGTVSGLRALINAYGVPDTILRISEFGGKDLNNSNDWDYYQSNFNYATYNSSSSATSRISSSFTLNSKWDSHEQAISPTSVLFRFKPYNILPSSNEYAIVFKLDGSTDGHLTLTYTGSAYSSASYSGAIPSASNKQATLAFWAGTGTKIIETTASFYDGNWWGVQISRTSGSDTQTYTLRTANKVYNGADGFKIGYTSSVTDTTSNSVWSNADDFTLGNKNGGGVDIDSQTYKGLTGSFQELRFYNTVLEEEVFHDFVMNPYSIEGNDFSSSAENLAFRAPLGSDLKIKTGEFTSVHPKISSPSIVTQSFASDSTYYIGSDIIFPTNTEFVYYDQPAVGIKNRISEKIRVANLITASGNTLTPYKTIEQRYVNSESYTRDVNYLEVAFSPQNEINDDINSSFGYFNIGEYIGDPSDISGSSTSYKSLDKLRDTYFEKYESTYDWKDYIRLIKYFDNSLFKMLKDFVPSKTSISTGIVVKQHILERNRQRPAILSGGSYNSYSSSISVSDSEFFVSGSTGGSFNPKNYSGSGQVWEKEFQTKEGPLIVLQTDQKEFYNGELNGTEFTASRLGEVGPPRLKESGNQFFTGSKIPKDYVDPLLNLVEDQITSNFYYRLEFSDSVIVASNLDLVTGSSIYTRAEIGDDLASRRAWTTSRYKGSRVSSRAVNQAFKQSTQN